jgi:hypothetical protein
MMACCLIAAMLLAQIMGTVRRWGVFWGVVRPVEGEVADTAYRRSAAWLRASLRRSPVKAAVFAIAGLELAALSGWVYVAHGTHLYQIGDKMAGAVRGETIVYSGICGRDGKDRIVRIVINRAGPGGWSALT